jgi:hypothetical protein
MSSMSAHHTNLDDRAASWLSLAAAPTFATMALLTGLGGGPQDMLCAASHGASPLGGMIPMYMLMSALHLGPWLKLIAGQRNQRRSEGETRNARHFAQSRDQIVISEQCLPGTDHD